MVNNGLTQSFNKSAFGDLATTSISPRIQLQFPYNINYAEVSVSVTNGGTVYQSQPFAVCSATVANSSALLSSLNNLHYRTGQGGLAVFTAIYTLGTTGSTQQVGLGNSTDGFLFGYNATVFGIDRRNNGVDNWIPQASWNQDPMNGTGPSLMNLDPTKGNVYKIQYQWLGFGDINFFIENPLTDSFVLVHQIQYPNSFTITTITNPSLPLIIYAANTTNATNISVKSPSMGAFVEGILINTGLLFSVSGSNAAITTTESSILIIKNNSSFSSITNQKFVQPLQLSLSNASGTAQDCTFKVTLNPNLGVSPVYTNVSTTTSVVSYTVTGTTVRGGRVLATYFAYSLNSITVDVSDLNIILNNSDILVFSGFSSAGTITARCAAIWNEQF